MDGDDLGASLDEACAPFFDHDPVVPYAGFDGYGEGCSFLALGQVWMRLVELSDGLEGARFESDPGKWLAAGPVLYALSRLFDKFEGQVGCANESGSAARGGHVFGGAAHVDIQAIKAQLTDYVRGLVK